MNFPIAALPFKPRVAVEDEALTVYLIPANGRLSPLLQIVAPQRLIPHARSIRIEMNQRLEIRFANQEPVEFFWMRIQLRLTENSLSRLQVQSRSSPVRIISQRVIRSFQMSLHVCILGIDGSGKSTVVSALPAILAAETGFVVGSAGDSFRIVAADEDHLASRFHPDGLPLSGPFVA